MKKMIFLFIVIVVATTTMKAQQISSDQLSYYQVNLRQNANYKYLQNRGYAEMIAIAKEYLATGFIENDRYYIELPQKGSLATAVELNPVAKENARFRWAGKNYGILDPNKRSDHILVDSQTGKRIVVGCGNEVTDIILIGISDYVYGEVKSRKESNNAKPKELKKKAAYRIVEDAPKNDSISIVIEKKQKVDLSGMSTFSTTESKAKYLDNQIKKQIDMNAVKTKIRWKPWALFRQVEVSPFVSFLIDGAAATLIGVGAYKIFSHSGSSSENDENPTYINPVAP